MARPIGTGGTIDNLVVGGRTFVDLDPADGFKGLVGTVSSGSFTTFRDVNGTSGYAPPGGKTFKILAIKLYLVNASASASSAFNLGYADTDAGVQGGGPTNQKYVGNDNSNAHIFPIPWQGSANGPVDNAFELSYGESFTVPTGKFPFITGSGGGQILAILYGYEV